MILLSFPFAILAELKFINPVAGPVHEPFKLQYLTELLSAELAKRMVEFDDEMPV